MGGDIMTTNLANGLYRYFNSLHELNKSIIGLCGTDVIDNYVKFEKYIDIILQLVPRLVPYSKVKEKDEYIINRKDGLIQFCDELPFIESDYSKLLKNHYTILDKIKILRNKLEHKMHCAEIISAGNSTSDLFDVIFKLTDKNIRIFAKELICLAADLNWIFTKIQNEIDSYAFSEGKSANAFYRNLLRVPFADYNKIYNSDLLITFGKIMSYSNLT